MPQLMGMPQGSRRRLVAWIWMAAASTIVPARAQWTSSGPFGGSAEIVRTVPREPGHVLAATGNALLYESRNGGASWTPLPFPAQLAGTLHDLAVDPRAPGTWYAAMESENRTAGGIFQTRDGGASWRRLPGMEGRAVWSLSLWPGDSRWIAAGAADGVFLSGDAGDSWSRISPEGDPELRPVVSLAFDPTDRRVLYAGTLHLPWRTRDGGAHWQSIHDGMIDDSDVFSIAVDARAPASVFSSACSGVYRSGDGGGSWTRLKTPQGAFRTYLVALDPAHAGVVFAATSAGLLRSTDRGAAWTTVTPHAVKAIAFDPANPLKIYLASTTGGLLVSRDGGKTVAEFSTGFVNRNFTAVAASGTALYAATVYEPGSGGIFRSRNRGLRWDHLRGPDGGENIVRLAAPPDHPEVLFAAGYRGMYRSADAGETWGKPVPLPPGGAIRALAALPGGRLLAGGPSGLFAFSGIAWEAVPLAGAGGIDQLQTSPGGLAVLTSTGAFRSFDGGRSWAACGQPRNDAVWYGLAFAAEHVGIAYAATSRGLFRSIDSCASWSPVRGLDAATASVVVCHPEHPGEAFAAQSGRIFRTADGGLTWSPLAADEPAGIYPDSLFFLAGAAERLFALFPRRGLLSHSINSSEGLIRAMPSNRHP